jgi:hypothetical protein
LFGVPFARQPQRVPLGRLGRASIGHPVFYPNCAATLDRKRAGDDACLRFSRVPWFRSTLDHERSEAGHSSGVDALERKVN